MINKLIEKTKDIPQILKNSNKSKIYALVSFSTLILFIFIISLLNHHAENKMLLTQLKTMDEQIIQLSQNNQNPEILKANFLQLHQALSEIKTSVDNTAKIKDMDKIAEQINVIKNNIDELKKLMINSNSGKEYLDAKELPFKVTSVDLISETPFITINEDHHLTPLEIGDSLSGWQLVSADYELGDAEFKNAKNQYIKVNVRGDDNE